MIIIIGLIRPKRETPRSSVGFRRFLWNKISGRVLESVFTFILEIAVVLYRYIIRLRPRNTNVKCV